jgi:hypothetical protein
MTVLPQQRISGVDHLPQASMAMTPGVGLGSGPNSGWPTYQVQSSIGGQQGSVSHVNGEANVSFFGYWSAFRNLR